MQPLTMQELDRLRRAHRRLATDPALEDEGVTSDAIAPDVPVCAACGELWSVEGCTTLRLIEERSQYESAMHRMHLALEDVRVDLERAARLRFGFERTGPRGTIEVRAMVDADLLRSATSIEMACRSVMERAVEQMKRGILSSRGL